VPTRNSDKQVLVVGATGNQGGAALRHLRARGFPVRAITRDPEKPQARALAASGVEVVRGDLDDPDSLRRAMDGVWGVYSVQAYQHGPEIEVRQGRAVADAAQRSRVSHLVYSSALAVDRNTGIPHFESKAQIEAYIGGLGVPYAIFRPGFFMENWLHMKNQINDGNILFPLSPNRRLPMLAVDDIGAFVAMAFEHADKWRNRAFDLAGDELPMHAIAERFGRKIGRQVRYRQTPWDQFETQAGSDLTKMFRWIEEHGFEVSVDAVRAQYDQLTTFDGWLNKNW
jgi:uncharacterized protein YbjT (DUF2867 family)